MATKIAQYLLLSAVCMPMAFAGPVYKVVKEDGSVIYTDQPVQGSEEVRFNEATRNVAAPLATPTAAPAQKKAARQIDYHVSVTSPEEEATLRDNRGNITITAAKTPPSAPARFQLTFDGEVKAVNTSGVFQLEGINRGAHQYSVQLVDNKGKTLASTSERTLFLHQASVFINNQ
ncbi:DUF4124 domain-containing protein [Alteromonas sp. CYL-A6]|uniref:DUF4124 domain-containing protein n=1 Tax=Alteromonas nitratireducens TaxID=3390813 RepID=UPI0034B14628